ncbi:MAG: alpha-amylase/4-alpha-glucanotransferase domain-containing protein [Elusimicrobiota bacterium]
MKKIYFLFGVHNHQPVGNFPGIFDMAYETAYFPFLELMEKHKNIKWTLHCTGILWDYFKEKRPEYIQKIKSQVKSGQVELLTGGYYEPILPILPERDRYGQITKLTSYIVSEFSCVPKGMWLAERVWESALPLVLGKAGVEFTLLDDYHFTSAGFSSDELNGYFITEEQGESLKVFPINQQLRYLIPWKDVKDSIEFFEKMATESGDRCLVMLDDGEKFGLWPETHKLIYEKKWLDNFLTEIEKNSEWLKTITPSEYLNTFPPRGRVYLPDASYFEMTQWALPSRAQGQMDDVVKLIDNMKEGILIRKFLKGGIWRNFLAKYPESNNMQKKMLYVSEKVNKAASKKTKKAQVNVAIESLYAGQCNCAYWHGVFGGLYLPHLRRGVYSKLINAENLIDNTVKIKIDKSTAKISEFDFDRDGFNELLYESSGQNLYFAPECGGSLFEWDIKPKGLNLCNNLTRRHEAYHRKLKEAIKLKNDGKLPQSAAELGLSQMKEENLDKYLHYDWYRKVCLLDHFLHPDTKYEDFYKCNYGEQGDFVNGGYKSTHKSGEIALKRDGFVWINNRQYRVTVEKLVQPLKEYGFIITYSITNTDTEKGYIVFAPEFNFSFASKEKEDELTLRTSKWIRKDNVQKIELQMTFDRELELWTFPIETVALSEGGFERTYQCTTVLPVLRNELPAGGKIELTIKCNV